MGNYFNKSRNMSEQQLKKEPEEAVLETPQSTEPVQEKQDAVDLPGPAVAGRIKGIDANVMTPAEQTFEVEALVPGTASKDGTAVDAPPEKQPDPQRIIEQPVTLPEHTPVDVAADPTVSEIQKGREDSSAVDEKKLDELAKQDETSELSPIKEEKTESDESEAATVRPEACTDEKPEDVSASVPDASTVPENQESHQDSQVIDEQKIANAEKPVEIEQQKANEDPTPVQETLQNDTVDVITQSSVAEIVPDIPITEIPKDIFAKETKEQAKAEKYNNDDSLSPKPSDKANVNEDQNVSSSTEEDLVCLPEIQANAGATEPQDSVAPALPTEQAREETQAVATVPQDASDYTVQKPSAETAVQLSDVEKGSPAAEHRVEDIREEGDKSTESDVANAESQDSSIEQQDPGQAFKTNESLLSADQADDKNKSIREQEKVVSQRQELPGEQVVKEDTVHEPPSEKIKPIGDKQDLISETSESTRVAQDAVLARTENDYQSEEMKSKQGCCVTEEVKDSVDAAQPHQPEPTLDQVTEQGKKETIVPGDSVQVQEAGPVKNQVPEKTSSVPELTLTKEVTSVPELDVTQISHDEEPRHQSSDSTHVSEQTPDGSEVSLSQEMPQVVQDATPAESRTETSGEQQETPPEQAIKDTQELAQVPQSEPTLDQVVQESEKEEILPDSDGQQPYSSPDQVPDQAQHVPVSPQMQEVTSGKVTEIVSEEVSSGAPAQEDVQSSICEIAPEVSEITQEVVHEEDDLNLNASNDPPEVPPAESEKTEEPLIQEKEKRLQSSDAGDPQPSDLLPVAEQAQVSDVPPQEKQEGVVAQASVEMQDKLADTQAEKATDVPSQDDSTEKSQVQIPVESQQEAEQKSVTPAEEGP